MVVHFFYKYLVPDGTIPMGEGGLWLFIFSINIWFLTELSHRDKIFVANVLNFFYKSRMGRNKVAG